MSESVPKHSTGRDYDPGGERLSADSDPREAFLTYVDEKHTGAIGDMGFTFQNFKDYIAELRRRRDIDELIKKHNMRDTTVTGRCIGIVGMRPPRK
jgi:hypothetical protein